MKKLPSFFVIGAQKAGTTTLHDWLVRQPNICLPKLKETHFFSDPEQHRLGIGWYLRQFPRCGNNAIVGEVDPDYLFFRDTPVRIKERIIDPKFVVILRNPLDRAYSHYQMSRRRGYEELRFREALLQEQERLSDSGNNFELNHHSYMARGRYSELILHYRSVFPSADFLFVKFDDLFGKDTGFETYSRICKFIGLKSPPSMTDMYRKSNPASEPRSLWLRDFLFKPSLLRKFTSRLLPAMTLKMRISYFLDQINQRPLEPGGNGEHKTVPQEIMRNALHEVELLEKVAHLQLRDWMEVISTQYGT